MKLKQNKQDAVNQLTESKINYTSNLFSTNDHIVRQKQEIKRRFSALQSCTIYLERELKIVKSCMKTLDTQLQNFSRD